MKALRRGAIAIGSLLPYAALAHESTHHAEQTLLQQILDKEHIVFYALPTLLVTLMLFRVWKKRNVNTNI